MKDLPKDALHAVLYGTGKENLTIYYERANGRGTLERPFEGVLNNVCAPLERNPVRRDAQGIGGVHVRASVPQVSRKPAVGHQRLPSRSAA